MSRITTWLGRPADSQLNELGAFYSTQFNEPAAPIVERLRWERENPSRAPSTPFAVCLTNTSGTLAGAMLCVPYRLTLDSRPIAALMSAGYYVDAAMHGGGLRVFQKYREFGSEYVLYATTANVAAAKIWKWAKANPLPHTEFEHLRPIRFAHLLEERLSRIVAPSVSRTAGVVLSLTDSVTRLRRFGARGDLVEMSSAGDAVPPRAGAGLQPIRDESFIKWRFLDVPQADARVYRYRDPARVADACVAVARRRRGYRNQTRTLAVADIWGELPPDALPGMLGSLARRHSQTDDVIVLRSVPARYLGELATANCIRRNFEGNVGWCIDDSNVLGPEPPIWPSAATELV